MLLSGSDFTHVGFGLLGEEGAESIHAKFNSLGRAYTAIPDRVERLKCIMKEHLVSIVPDMVARAMYNIMYILIELFLLVQMYETFVLAMHNTIDLT